MTSQNIQTLLSDVLSIRYQIETFIRETNQILDEAKITKRDKKKELDIFYDNYRKDKFLEGIYLNVLYELINYIKSYPDYTINKNYTKLITLTSLIIDTHESTIMINKDNKSNATTHFSHRGIKLVNSFDFSELKRQQNIFFSEY
jgi:hypothetical protein